MPGSLLFRASLSHSAQALSLVQNQVDRLVGEFVDQATDWKSLAAMTVGGVSYRLGRSGAMSSLRATPLRALSIRAVRTAEVSAVELTNRGLTSVSVGVDDSAPLQTNLWRWSGQGGLQQGLLQSLVTFGTLKGFGRLTQGQSLILQHLAQDTGMVAGHHASALLGITPAPEGSLAEQFLHAEATNLQIGAGMALGHELTGGKLLLSERGLDLKLQSREFESVTSPRIKQASIATHPFLSPLWMFLGAGGLGGGDASGKGGKKITPEQVEKIASKGIDWEAFDGNFDRLIQEIRESGAEPGRIIFALFKISKDHRYQDSFAPLIQAIQEAGDHPTLVLASIAELIGHWRFQGPFEPLIHSIQSSRTDRYLKASVLGHLASNYHFQGPFEDVIDYIQRSAYNPDIRAQALGALASNHHFQGPFDPLVRHVQESGAEEEATLNALGRMAGNPRYPHLQELLQFLDHLDVPGFDGEKVNAIGRILSNYNFEGDFSEGLRRIRKIKGSYTRLHPNGEALWDEDSKMISGRETPDFSLLLETVRNRGEPAMIAFTARLFAHYVSDPKLNPARKEALHDVIIEGLNHTDPLVRDAFTRLLPTQLKEYLPGGKPPAGSSGAFGLALAGIGTGLATLLGSEVAHAAAHAVRSAAPPGLTGFLTALGLGAGIWAMANRDKEPSSKAREIIQKAKEK